MNSGTERNHAPQLLGMVELDALAGEPGVFRFLLPVGAKDEITILLECDAQEFPFEKYCRFVRHPGAGHPYTFSSMEFHAAPPGIRLGPWPGWRGIPDFPGVTVSRGSTSAKLQPSFWGDETTSGTIRFFGRLSASGDEAVAVRSNEPRIIPRRAFIYRSRVLTALNHPIGLLPALAGTHPRLLIAPNHLPFLRARANGSHQLYFQKLLSLWGNQHLPFDKTPESKCVPGPERLSGEDRVLISAFIGLIMEDEESIRQALDAYATYVQETARPGFEPLGVDTQSGEVLFVMSAGYDWLHSWMPERDRKAAWEQIERVAAICRSYLNPERSDYGQAHYLGCGLGLLAYSFLAVDGNPGVRELTSELRGALDCAMDLLSDDGSYPHGMNLWIYEFGFLLRWIELFRSCAGDDIWKENGPALGEAAAFRAATLSSNAGMGITFGDPQYRVGGDSWCHFLIASRTGSRVAQWLGEKLLDLPHEGVDFRNVPARRRVYEFLFFDPAIAPTPPVNGVRTFAEIGQVVIRSPRTIVVMRSGPPLGSKRYAAGEYGGYGHSDPASGSFLIERDGRFVASGPGPVYKRNTGLHNVVTIGGKGQVGDSTVWLPDFFPPDVLPPVPEVIVEGECTSLAVDLARAYLPELGVDRYTRAMHIDPERVILGMDMLACRSVSSIEWNVHSWFPFKAMPGQGSLVFDLGGGVRLALLSPKDANWDAGLTEFIPAYPNDGTRDFQCVARILAARACFIWCYLLDSQPLPLLHRRTDEAFTVAFADGRTLDWEGRRFILRGKL